MGCTLFAFMGFCYNHIHSKKKLLFPLVLLYAPNNSIHSERVYYPFGMAGMGLLDKASLVGLVSDLCAFSALITAIIVRIVAS